MSGFDLPGLQGRGARQMPLVGDAVSRARPEGAAGGSFGGALADAIGQVDSLQDAVGKKYEALATGQPLELHDLMSAMGKSEVAFNLLLEVKNKLVDAWDKLSRAVV
jgi:flagellar hook-basal body complex protein FliE